MTVMGGREVAAAVRLAGFPHTEVKRAQAVAYAASKWQSHFEVHVPGSPSLTQWGLFAVNPNTASPSNPRELFHPVAAARDALVRWTEAGGNWDWHPITTALGGSVLRAAWLTLDEHNLWNSKEQDTAHLAIPLGHPEGIVPPWPFGEGFPTGGLHGG